MHCFDLIHSFIFVYYRDLSKRSSAALCKIGKSRTYKGYV